tara:strand:+ start:4215 stop:4394 length:180 start_codon:yes stop_codon:yes gene_type:complete
MLSEGPKKISPTPCDAGIELHGFKILITTTLFTPIVVCIIVALLDRKIKQKNAFQGGCI